MPLSNARHRNRWGRPVPVPATEFEKLCEGMSEKERAAIAKRAERIGRRIIVEMTKALGHKPYLR